MAYALVNAKIFDGERFLDKAPNSTKFAVCVEEEKIELVEEQFIPESFEKIDLKGAILAPGFIDLQVNGGGGVLFNDDISINALLKIFNAHQQFGTTSMLPTLITTSFSDMLAAIKVMRNIDGSYGSQFLGLHLEGPYISIKRRGTHNPNYVRKASDNEIEEIAQSSDVVRLITVAPESVSREQVSLLTEKGIVVSIGHTDATKDEVLELIEAGATCYTHLFNAMSQLGSREGGAVGSALDSKNSYAGIIVDGFHVDYGSLRIAEKCIGDRLFLVTDAMPPVGSEITNFKIGELLVICDNGKCVNSEGALAGSALDMATAVSNTAFQVGVGIEKALKMATLNPALAIGEKSVGRIKTGYKANMVVLSNELKLQQVIQDGKLIV